MVRAESLDSEIEWMSVSPATFLIISQVFPPDPAAVGQYMLDAAIDLRRRGHRVRVITANRGYEDPTRRYPARQSIEGVHIRRLGFSSFGKKPIYKRLAGSISFMLQVFWAVLTCDRVDGILFSTSPPMVGFVVSIAAMFRRIPTAYWAMDLNPDQLIALKKLTPTSLPAKALEWINRFILRHTSLVIALDRFMADRLRKRSRLDGKMVIIPPWPHERYVTPIDRTANPFRAAHGLDGKFVVMYSGLHTTSNPLSTLLEATLAFKDDPSLVFAFVGGGQGKGEIESHIASHQLRNVLSLPYQPLENLRYSLSAADVHVVSLGTEMVGIVHPCKIYSAMAIARPILFFGPRPSHIADLLDGHPFGFQIRHGDVRGAIDAIRRLRSMSDAELSSMGNTALDVLHHGLGQPDLCGKFCDAIERHLLRPRATPPEACTDKTPVQPRA